MSDKFKIEDLGWNSYFESKKAELKPDYFSVARVTAEHKGLYKIKNEKGEYAAKITGKQIFEAASREDYPAVGDWVAISELDNKQAVIQAIFPRKSVIKRIFGDKNKSGKKNDVQIIASNIDVAFIVESVGRDYNINRFERYLAILEDARIKPVIVINKTDMISRAELDTKLSEIRSRLENIDIVATSTIAGKGLEELRNFIERGRTYCFLGSSGVGKSSLINKLLGRSVVKTDSVSSYSNRGRHVTTGREMYFLESGGIVIDNPGIKEVGMADADKGIDNLFNEMENLAKKCQFTDCTHIHEPGCEVLAAVKGGKLDKGRYSNYINLKKEAGYYEMNAMEKREKDRNFGKFMKKAKREMKDSGHKYF